MILGPSDPEMITGVVAPLDRAMVNATGEKRLMPILWEHAMDLYLE